MGEDRPPYRALRSPNIVESGGRQMMRKGTGTVYRIVVHDELSERYAVAFEGMEMETKNGQTVLTGEIIDQSHLHGILGHIGALGLKLVSVETHPLRIQKHYSTPAKDGRSEGVESIGILER
jgi:hypothetical protein